MPRVRLACGPPTSNCQLTVERYGRRLTTGPARVAGRRVSNPGQGRPRVIGTQDDGLSERQQVVLDAIRASHPRPVATAQLADRLGITEGRLNITLRSLHRRRLIAPASPVQRRHGGWTAPRAETGDVSGPHRGAGVTYDGLADT